MNGEREMAPEANRAKPLHVLVVGCGLGGLACAIGCRREGLRVTVLEQASELAEIGAGIQIPPNAARVMMQYGLMDRLISEGRAIALEYNPYSHYTDGEVISNRPGSAWAKKQFGCAWYVIHRADYRRIMFQEAERLGADVVFDRQVVRIDCQSPSAKLGDGAIIEADVIIGADGMIVHQARIPLAGLTNKGLNSTVRTDVLGKHIEPEETGDLAYRATITKEHTDSLNNTALDEMLSPIMQKVWWGPDSHAVLYPVRGGDVFNLVLAVPDDLPPHVSKVPGSIEQMRRLFEGWDPRLRALIAEVPSSLKWKLVTFTALETWVRGSVALLGDACHPTLPYQAQGAAMAVEDGACIARILGLAARGRTTVPASLRLYEKLRKDRTTLNVEGANGNQKMYHAHGQAAKERAEILKDFNWDDPDATSPYKGFNDMPYQRALLGFDTLKDAEDSFRRTFGDGALGNVVNAEESPAMNEAR